jgi:chemotaxis protein MotB
MVDPARPIRLALALSAATLAAGCGLVPKAQLDDCHKLSRTLQEETGQLKDVNLRLRAENQDLAQRTVEDARRLKVLDEENQRLERSVLAYQEERDHLLATFEQFQRQITASVDRLPSAMLDKFRSFTALHAGCQFDPNAGVLSFPSDVLFEPESERWIPNGQSLIEQCARLLTETRGRSLGLRVVGMDPGPAVIRTALTEPRPEGQELAKLRARKVRDLLANATGIDATQVGVAAAEDRAGPGAGSRIELHITP